MLSMRSRSNISVDGNKAPLLSDYGSRLQKEEYDKLSKAPSRISALGSMQVGELPIGQGCNFTQTVFNGEHNFVKFCPRVSSFYLFDNS